VLQQYCYRAATKGSGALASTMAAKTTRTFSLDKSLLAEVKRSRGDLSESERVNRLLRFALGLEKRAALEREIAAFFSDEPQEQAEHRAFEAAGISSWTRK